jgi:very-short-patch-repair endonuclease
VTGVHRGRRPRIRVHRVHRLEEDERSIRHGVPVTAPARTIIDVATVVGTRELENFVARGEREGLIEREELMRLVDRHAGRPGTRAVRDLLHMGTGPALTRSEAEIRFLRLVREAGLPEPETNVVFGPYEIDFFWRSARIAVEVDGYRHHSSRPRFEGDRRKDAWLAAAGITVVRLSWDQIVRQPLSTAVQLGQALAHSHPQEIRVDPPGQHGGRTVSGTSREQAGIAGI